MSFLPEFLEKRPTLKSLLILFAVAVALHFVCSLFSKGDKEAQATDKVTVREAFASAYQSYSFETYREAKKVALRYAEELYNKEVAAGKTTKKFRGFTRLGYYYDAIDKYDEEIGQMQSLSLMLPFYILVLAGVALILSISLRIRSVKPLDFEVQASQFTNR